jgi:hypothetical protein
VSTAILLSTSQHPHLSVICFLKSKSFLARNGFVNDETVDYTSDTVTVNGL